MDLSDEHSKRSACWRSLRKATRQLRTALDHQTKPASNPSPQPPTYRESLKSKRQEIRVLEVAPGTDDGLLECTTKLVSLLQEPPPVYETISYCWGPPREPAHISLNGYIVAVPYSSEAAVRRMRLPNKPRVLWIDAICINQASPDERSQQVAMMASVYRLGKQNLIYLGEDDHGSAQLVIEEVKKLVADMRSATADFSLVGETMYDKETMAPLYAKEALSIRINYESLHSVVRLPWFRRLWVIQEAVLAPSNICHWGAVQFHLLDILRAMRWLHFHWYFITNEIKTAAGYPCTIIMWELLNPLRWFSRQILFTNILVMGTHFERTEPRDSIYAIVGLLQSEEAYRDDLAMLLRVDYTKPLPDILRDATRYALNEVKSVSGLHLLGHSTDNIDRMEEDSNLDIRRFPTWTVRVDLKPDVAPLPYFFRAGEGLQAPSLLLDVSYGAEVLLCQGIVADSVLETTVTCEGDALHTYKGFYAFLWSAKEMVSRLHNPRTQEDIQITNAAMAFALTASKAFGGGRAQEKDLLVLVDYLRDLSSFEDVTTAVEKTRQMAGVTEFLCLDRRLFVTTAGRIGLGPRCMKKGDQVVVLRGGKWPFILRAKGDRYQILGPAYVHGIMYGEAVALSGEKGEEEMVFPIE